MNHSILVIPDQYFPYAHKDIFPFLQAVKKQYKPDLVINLGDELDYHALSFHDSDPDLYSAGHELERAIEAISPMYKMFPKMELLHSNHGSMVFRKALSHGFPRQVFKSYREMITASQTWRWHEDLIIKTPLGRVYFCHAKSSDAMKLSQSMGMSAVQGHLHEKFELKYWGNKLGLFFAMNSGCLIDNDSLAYAYNRLNLKRPVIGCSVIINGIPKLIPMVLNHYGRWTGELP